MGIQNAAGEQQATARILVNAAGVAPCVRVIDRKGKPTSLARCTQVIDINLIGTSNILPEFAVRGLALEPDASGECGKDRGVGLKLPAVRELAQDQDQGVDVCMDCDSKDGREKYMAGWRPMF